LRRRLGAHKQMGKRRGVKQRPSKRDGVASGSYLNNPPLRPWGDRETGRLSLTIDRPENALKKRARGQCEMQ